MSPSGSRPVGVMGGTFDPIHNGHLVAADEALFAFGLQEIIFVPAGRPWQKAEHAVTDAEDRYQMVVLATAPNPKFSVSRLEIEREGPTYTVETLRALQTERPDADLHFITGADAILDILTWKDPEEVLAEARFIAVTRPGYDLGRLSSGLPPSLRDRVTVLAMPLLAISSTDIRARVAQGRSIRYLVPDEVADFIAKHGLYGAVSRAR